MADDEKEEEVIPPRGVDWEVVSLTASAYAAAPYPKDFDPNDEVGSKQESSSPMFMSGHFVFPPSEHENLPIEPEIQNISEGDTVISAEEEGEDDKQNMLDDDSQGPKHFDDGTAVSARSLEFEEVKELLSMETANPGDSPNQDLNSPRKFEKLSDADSYDASGHPCWAWWKKNASSLYHHAKEANTFWSIFVAAALTGLVILGKRWHRDKCHAQELRHHLNINNEKTKGAMAPLGRLKNIIISSR
ncbi:ATG8-interacting protein 1 [Asparagus officinalis]|uniref:ATG8-interacting protein 1 n=1 Tax=Asparagus officinalis TaxID=4686 RepID=UPI00098DFB2B|nr:ATG8-interacting protein 1 [Asparagus officinalis]XP_020251848.1 ATG8-interacting protein 1 [Asparagus officinalis]XP_020251849.1 ATG8-interacting protein 1 [Asparagus officinalis]XP_020251850.1 ATG8-interacting protein 1 [Asparagus officinalis]XP_020251851.1 ATG8-interacting protein 1 [Asparagus officinalis]